MRWADFERNLHDDKKVLRTGMFLLAFAAALVLLVLRFDAVWGAAQMVSATLTPVVGGIVVAYVLDVFVHLFEDVVFKPFQKSRNRVWKKLCFLKPSERLGLLPRRTVNSPDVNR